jgi:diaminohydroxyphosphoribosylaminopyrimidine deaminase/5-amino-6-(5-phosphoribosylamino)uracil reductase
MRDNKQVQRTHRWVCWPLPLLTPITRARPNEEGDVMINIDDAYARLASLSAANLGKTAPNPNVAAAIYRADGTLIAEGAHNRFTSPDHAEVVAIKKAGDAARGATIVVSLEPCNHTGTTGPCVDAIIDAGISKVIYAVKDPNPVAAGGADRLKSAGADVQFVASPELEDIQGAWLHRITTGRPLFIWKIATTLDGRIAASDGTSQWISSEQSRADVQLLRSQSEAILIGTGTALADNPTLRPRIEGATSPIRIVMGGRDVPADFNLNDGKSQTIFLKSHSVDDLLKALDYIPVNQVFVEAGPQLGSALMAAGIIDEVILYQAPIVLGEGKSWLEGIGVSTIADARQLTLISSEKFGSDIKFRYRVEKR